MVSVVDAGSCKTVGELDRSVFPPFPGAAYYPLWFHGTWADDGRCAVT